MTTSTRVAMTRTDVSAAIVLLLIAEATFFFTFLFVVGPIATLARLLPLAAVSVRRCIGDRTGPGGRSLPQLVFESGGSRS